MEISSKRPRETDLGYARRIADSTTETKPSEPAMRAAMWCRQFNPKHESFVANAAAAIDRETQLPQILEALGAAKEMGDHIDLFQGLPLKRIFVQAFDKLDAILAAHKPR